MAKFHGVIGFVQQAVETTPGVWEDPITEVLYKGDILRETQKNQSSDEVLPRFDLNNRISILADAYANENFQYIRYVEYRNVLWNVVSVEIQGPRLILSLRGVYHGN